MPVVDGVSAAWASISSDLTAVSSDVSAETIFASIMTGGGELEAGIMLGAAVNPEIDAYTITLALAALIIAFAFKYIVAYPLAWVLGKIPFVGGTLAGWVTDIGNWEQSTVLGMLTGPVTIFVEFLNFLYAFFINLPIALGQAIAAVASLLHWVTNTQVPWVYNTAIAYAQEVFATTEANMLTYFNAEESDLHNTAVVLEQDITSAYNEATTYATDVYNTVETDLHADFAWTYQVVQEITQVIEVEIPDEFAKVEQQIGTAFTQAEDDAERLFQEAEAQASQDLDLAIAGVMVVVGGVAGIINNFLDNCGNTMCKSNGQNAKNVQNLANLIGDGLLLAYLGAAIRDPEGTAAVTIPLIEPLATVGGTLVDDLVAKVA